jgi:hypothetical protein
MNDNDDFMPNAILLEISVDEEGRMLFSGGWSFDEEYPQDTVEFLQDILAGIYAIINTQTENVVAAGKIVRSAPGFDGFEPREEDEYDYEIEIGFEPDEELTRRIKEQNKNDLNVIKFDPKKHRKH